MEVSGMLYRVKFLHLVERTKDVFDYSDLLDALRVIKETQLDGFAMTDKRFDEGLMQLLTMSLIYRGHKTSEHPEGVYAVMLTRVENGAERAVYSNVLTVPPVAKIPNQRPDFDNQVKCGSDKCLDCND
jgi:hypothetical protein